MILLLLILKIIVSMMLMPLTMMILTRKSVVVGAGQKPTPVKSWQVPPLLLPATAHLYFFHLVFVSLQYDALPY